MNQPQLGSKLNLATLWENLTNELFGIYDSHHVCAAAAQELAAFTSRRVLVMLQSHPERYYDVWLSDTDRTIEQFRWQGEEELSAQLKAKRVIEFDKRTDEFSLMRESLLWDVPLQSAMLAPFMISAENGTPSGAICVVDPIGSGFDSTTLNLISQYISTFIERAVLRHRVTQKEIEFDVVNDISIALTSTLSLEDIFEKVANPVRRILNVESVSIGLIEKTTGDLVFVPALLGPLFEGKEIRLTPGQGIAGFVALQGQSVIVNDAYNDPRFFSDPDEMTGFQSNTILCVPLLVENEVIGVLEAINKKLGTFDETDRHLMEAIASPLAIALENAQLHADVVTEKRRIETIFDNMSEGMLTVDGDGVITGANDSLATLLQVTVESLLGKKAQETIKAKGLDFNKFVAKVLNMREEPPNLACDVYVGYPSDAVPVLISGASIRDENFKVSEAFYVFSDLRQIREVERMRDDFFHNIVHELRTPLATILLYARLLRKDLIAKVGGEKEKRFISMIERESDRLQTMVRQMLSLAKLEASEIQGSLRRVNLNAIFEEVLPPLADRALEKGLTLKQKIEAPLPRILGDHEILYSIIKNLTENAIKFTLEGTVSVEAWLEDSYVYIEIADEGIGISQEALPNLFKRFYRTNTAVEHGIAGTGLGLYMVKEGIERHKGTINVLSEVGKGTTFYLRLPINPTSPKATRPEPLN